MRAGGACVASALSPDTVSAAPDSREASGERDERDWVHQSDLPVPRAAGKQKEDLPLTPLRADSMEYNID